MGKLKDLVTDVTFTLKAHGQTQVKAGRKPQVETFYVYEGTNGGTIKFCSHPTKAWCFMILEGTNAIGRLCATPITNAFVAAGLERGDKSFNEAIATLKI